VPQSSKNPKSSFQNAAIFEKIEDRKIAQNAEKITFSALDSCRLVRKEYGMVRNRTDCIARETDFFQEFRIFDRIFVRAMLKECWSSELRRAKSTKAHHIAFEEDGNDALRGGEIRMCGYIKYVIAISHWLGSFIEFSKTKLKWIKIY
jgi:hypothetical protein